MVDSSHLHHHDSGDGEPIVLLHGTAAASDTWLNQVNFLIKHQYRAITIDLPGHGQSPQPASLSRYDSIEAYAWIEASIENLGLNDPITLVGHSLGGFYCLWHTLQHPEKVARLVLLSPFYSKTQLNRLVQQSGHFATIAGKIKNMTPEWLVTSSLGSGLTEKPPLGIEDRRQIAANYKSASSHVYHMVQSAPDLTDRLDAVDAPTLVIWGNRDRTLHPDSFDQLVKRMPRAGACCLEGCGHQVHLSQPAIVNERMLQFLESFTQDLAV